MNEDSRTPKKCSRDARTRRVTRNPTPDSFQSFREPPPHTTPPPIGAVASRESRVTKPRGGKINTRHPSSFEAAPCMEESPTKQGGREGGRASSRTAVVVFNQCVLFLSCRADWHPLPAHKEATTNNTSIAHRISPWFRVSGAGRGQTPPARCPPHSLALSLRAFLADGRWSVSKSAVRSQHNDAV